MLLHIPHLNAFIHTLSLSLSQFSPLSNDRLRQNPAAKKFRASFPSFTTLPQRRGSIALLRISISRPYMVFSFCESSRVPRSEVSPTQCESISLQPGKREREKTAKIMANCLVEFAYTHAPVHMHACTTDGSTCSCDLQSAPLEGGFLRDKTPAKHEAAIRGKLARLENAIPGKSLRKISALRSSVRHAVPACARMYVSDEHMGYYMYHPPRSLFSFFF